MYISIYLLNLKKENLFFKKNILLLYIYILILNYYIFSKNI